MCFGDSICRKPNPAIRSYGVFVLDQRLLQDTLPVGDFPLSRLLLSNDSQYPWFILVPRRADISEVFQLSDADQAQLWKETTVLSKALSQLFQADKMNVGALGNVVSQLHMHVIVRHKHDIAWPTPVWGKYPAVPYSAEQVADILTRLKTALTVDFTFAENRS
jgi:diadenosine tetraphosphate (Ap4A) HIT family hydrolase